MRSEADLSLGTVGVAAKSRPTVARIERGDDVSTPMLTEVATALALKVELKREGRVQNVGGIWQDLSNRRRAEEHYPWGRTMAQRAFISFDYDHDARLKDLLLGQAKHSDTPFEIADWSIKTASPTWKAEARRRIKAAGLVIVLCGQHTHTAVGVAEELRIAKEEGVPYFLLAGYQTGNTKPTTATTGDKLYKWTWDNLKALVKGSR